MHMSYDTYIWIQNDTLFIGNESNEYTLYTISLDGEILRFKHASKDIVCMTMGTVSSETVQIETMVPGRVIISDEYSRITSSIVETHGLDTITEALSIIDTKQDKTIGSLRSITQADLNPKLIMSTAQDGRILVTSIPENEAETHEKRIKGLEDRLLDLSGLKQSILPLSNVVYDIGFDDSRWDIVRQHTTRSSSMGIDTTYTGSIETNVSIDGNLKMSKIIRNDEYVLDFGRVESSMVPFISDTYSIGYENSIWHDTYAGEIHMNTIDPKDNSYTSLIGDIVVTGLLVGTDGGNIIPDPDYGNLDTHLNPAVDDVYDLGEETTRWSSVYASYVSGGSQGILIQGDMRAVSHILNQNGEIFEGMDWTNVHTDILSTKNPDIGSTSSPWKNVHASRISGTVNISQTDGSFVSLVPKTVASIGRSTSTWSDVWTSRFNGNINTIFIENSFGTDLLKEDGMFHIGTEYLNWGDIYASNIDIQTITTSEVSTGYGTMPSLGIEDTLLKSVWTETIYGDIDAQFLYGHIDANILEYDSSFARSVSLEFGSNVYPSITFSRDISSGFYIDSNVTYLSWACKGSSTAKRWIEDPYMSVYTDVFGDTSISPGLENIYSLGLERRPWNNVYGIHVEIDKVVTEADRVFVNNETIILYLDDFDRSLLPSPGVSIGEEGRSWGNVYIQTEVDSLLFDGDGSHIHGINASEFTFGVVDQDRLPDASIDTLGIVRLVDNTTTSDTFTASTANTILSLQIDTDTRAKKTIRIVSGFGLDGDGNIQSDITFKHTDRSSISNIQGTDGESIRMLEFDTFGHLQAHSLTTMDDRYYIENDATSRFLHVSGNTVYGNITVPECRALNANVEGDLRVEGKLFTIDAYTTVTDAVSVTNSGDSPALTIEQTGNNEIVRIQDDGIIVGTWYNGGYLYISSTSGNNLDTQIQQRVDETMGIFGNVDVHTYVTSTHIVGIGTNLTIHGSNFSSGVVPIENLPNASIQTRGIVLLDDTAFQYGKLDETVTSRIITNVYNDSNTRALKTVEVNAGVGLVGGGDLSSSRLIGHPSVSQTSVTTLIDGECMQNIGINTFGHVELLESVNMDTMYTKKEDTAATFIHSTGDTMAGSLSILEKLDIQNNMTCSGVYNSFGPTEDVLISPGIIQWNIDENGYALYTGSSYEIRSDTNSQTSSLRFSMVDTVDTTTPVVWTDGLVIDADGISTVSFVTDASVNASSFIGSGTTVQNIHAPYIDTGTIDIDRLRVASDTQAGIVQLVDGLDNISKEKAVTAGRMKNVWERASASAFPDVSISTGDGLSGGGILLDGTFVIQHDATTQQGNISLQDDQVVSTILFDTFGHVVSAVSKALDTRYYRKDESDALYVNISGDVVTGHVTVPSVSGNSQYITNINANNIKSGVVASEHLPVASTDSPGIVEIRDSVTSTSVTNVVSANSMRFLWNMIEEKAFPTVSVHAGNGIIGGGTIDSTKILTHDNTSSQPSTQNSGGIIATSLNFDRYGHIVDVVSFDMDTRWYTKTASDALFVNVEGDTVTGTLSFGTQYRQPIIIHDTVNGIGVQGQTLYYRSSNNTAWYLGGIHDDTVYNPGTDGSIGILIDDSGQVGISSVPVATISVEGNTLCQGYLYLGSTNTSIVFPTGEYGSVQTRSGEKIWKGYSIRDEFAFVSGPTSCGVYNTTDTRWLLECVPNDTVNITYEGNTKVSTTSYGLFVDEEFQTTSNVIGYASDKRLKTCVSNLVGILDTIKNIHGYRFTWDDNVPLLPMRGKDIGLLAQELDDFKECIAPAPFDHREDGKSISGNSYVTIQYEKVHAIVIQGVHDICVHMDEEKIRFDSMDAHLSETKNILEKASSILQSIECRI